jgi:hypothetical protein
MKKAIISLIILIVIAAVAFGFGYVPIRLEPGERVLMFSRTSGWDDEPLAPGVFSWRWELLIPRNVTFYSFPPETRRVRLTSTTSLPSAEVYRAFLEGSPALEERVRMRLRYRISDDGIAELAPMGLDAEGIASWYDDFDDRLRSVALDATAVAIRSFLDQDDELPLSELVTSTIESRISERFPEIDLEAVIVEEIAIPDVALYRIARETYMDVQERRRSALLEAAEITALEQTRQNERLEVLARYGEILDRHTVLLDYLEIAAQHGSDPLNLQQLQSRVEE